MNLGSSRCFDRQMEKKILFIGDIVGKPGRQVLKNQLPGLVQRYGVDVVIANGENAASGAGITKSLAQEIHRAGVDGITLGDHVWDQKGFVDEIDDLENLSRPSNLPSMCPGKPYLIVEKNGFRVGVITVLGHVFMKISASSAMESLDYYLPKIKEQTDAILVEVHAEATSEKVALGFYLDGKVSAVVGTHTHIPTSDCRLLPNGTAYQTDAGMTGPYDSVLGREVQPIVDKMRDGIPRRFPVATDNVQLRGCLITIKEDGLARMIEPIRAIL